MIPFQVENRLFRVPSYQFFKEAPSFSEVFELSAHATSGAENGDPIKLDSEKVSKKDFRCLLKILYPL